MADVETALAHWADHREEIDDLVEQAPRQPGRGTRASVQRRTHDAVYAAKIRFVLDDHYPC